MSLALPSSSARSGSRILLTFELTFGLALALALDLALNLALNLSLSRTSPRHQLEPFDDAIGELNAIIRGIQAGHTWHVHFEIVTAVRRLVVHHTELPTARQTSDVLVPFVVQQARSARSSVARNGLLALGDIVATCAAAGDRPQCGVAQGVAEKVDSVATTILELCAPSKPKIIRQTATELLDAACGAGRLRVVLAPELLRHVDHRNSEVVLKAAVSCAACVEGMSTHEITSELDKHALLPLLHKVGLGVRIRQRHFARLAPCS